METAGQPTPDELAKKAARTKLAGCGGCAGSILLLAIAFAIFGASQTPEATTPTDTPAERAERQRAMEARRTLGLHCTNGSEQLIPAFESQVRARLRDPASFQHIGTQIMPAVEGVHPVLMRYRAANGYGGLNVAVAKGKLHNADCRFDFVSMGDV